MLPGETGRKCGLARHPCGGLAVVLSGPSGAGKTTVCRGLIAQYGYERSVSATTRAPRAGERDGVDYHFMTRERFLEGVRRGEFLEHSEHFDNLYGTPKEPVERALQQGRTIILEIDINGAQQVMERLPAQDRFCIFLTAPDAREQERRLRNRRTEGEAAVRTRLSRAEKEIAQGLRYDARVENDVIERTVLEVHAHIQKAEARKNDGCGQA
ncbi:MAG: guanylate kinase [Candidatus Brocadiia bacterium]